MEPNNSVGSQIRIEYWKKTDLGKHGYEEQCYQKKKPPNLV